MRWRRMYACAVLLWSVSSASVSLARERAGPWPAPVPGWVPVKPGEHPRLFFRNADLPALRKRARTREGKAILDRLRFLLGGGEAMPAVVSRSRRFNEDGGKMDAGAYTLSHAAGFGHGKHALLNCAGAPPALRFGCRFIWLGRWRREVPCLCFGWVCAVDPDDHQPSSLGMPARGFVRLRRSMCSSQQVFCAPRWRRRCLNRARRARRSADPAIPPMLLF